MIELLPEVKDFLAKTRPMLIGGEWVMSASGETFETRNPATAKVLTEVTRGGEEDVNRAVKAAQRAMADDAWRKITPAERGDFLYRLADLMEKHADAFAQLETLDNGKTYQKARAGDVAGTIKVFRYFAGWPTKFGGETIPVSPGGGMDMFNYTRKEPVGIVGQVIPWNYPLSMAAWKLAPALAAGCAIILKPAEETPLTALRLGELIMEAGFPAGVVNIITGPGSTVGARISAHPDIHKVAFTGSTGVGKAIAIAATENLKRVSLELGGKSPNIVLPDADIDKVADGAAGAIFNNQGQTCTAGSRLYVHKDIFDEVMEAVAARAKALKIGPGLDPETQMGPLVSQRQLDTVRGYVEAGREQGGKIIAGGNLASLPDKEYKDGFFFEPTVFVDTGDTARVVREEIFGPVLTALPWDDEDDLLKRANDSVYGLSAGIWTNNLSKAHQIAHALEAGTVWVNCYNLVDPASPFGGYKESGWGREMGRGAMEMYSETKSIWINLG